MADLLAAARPNADLDGNDDPDRFATVSEPSPAWRRWAFSASGIL